MYLQEKEIIHILRNRDSLLQDISQKRRNIYKDLEYISDEIIWILSMRGHPMEAQMLHRKNDQPQGLDRVREMQEKKEKEYRQELYIHLEALQEERERIQRVWFCYQALPLEQYHVLQKLYVSKRLWVEVEREMGLNHRLMVKTRRDAINNIVMLFESNHTNHEIIEFKFYNQKPEKIREWIKSTVPWQAVMAMESQDVQIKNHDGNARISQTKPK